MSFYRSIAQFYDDIFPVNNEKIDFVTEYNNVKEQKILDIGCSTGTFDYKLSLLGHSIYGIDLDENMIMIAKKYENNKLKFLNMNMLDIDQKLINKSFDQVICFGNTLVHLKDLEQVLTLLSEIKLILKKGGKLKFQIINYDNILDNNITELPTIDNFKINFVRKYEFIDKYIKFNTKLTIKKTNKIISNSVKLYPLRIKDIKELLCAANYHNIKFYSDFSKTPFDKNNLRLVVECNN